MIYLYTASPGTGKTCWVVKQLVDNWITDSKNKDRKIYSNINGLKIEGIYPLPDGDDFRECEDGSIIIIDEPQDIEHYNSDSRGVNPVAKALSKHRHRGFDIHFITQDPSLLHKYVLKNVYLHYYLWRPAQRKTIEIYTFARAIVSPTATDFKNAYDKIWWRFEPYYLQYYKSTVLNTSQKTNSTKRNSVITTFIIFMLIIAYLMYPALKPHLFKYKDDKISLQSQTKHDETTDVVSVMQQSQNDSQLSVKTSNTASTTTVQSVDSIPIPQAPIKPIDPPKITGFAHFGDKCTAYLDNGAKADITNDECLSYATGKKHVELKQTIQDNYNNNYQYATQAEQMAYAPTQ